MAEAVVEQLELKVPAEEVFDFWSDADNFCAFVGSVEESRRVDLSQSRWLLKGPEGQSAEYEPEFFLRCLVDYRSRLVHGAALRGDDPEPDTVLDRGELECKRRPDGTTLLLLTYLLAERSDEPGVRLGPEDHNPYQRVHLHLDAILSRVLQESWSGALGEHSRELLGVRPDESRAPAGGDLDASDALISLLDEWDADDSGYDEETLSVLKDNLDRNRPEYRKLFGRG